MRRWGRNRRCAAVCTRVPTRALRCRTPDRCSRKSAHLVSPHMSISSVRTIMTRMCQLGVCRWFIRRERVRPCQGDVPRRLMRACYECMSMLPSSWVSLHLFHGPWLGPCLHPALTIPRNRCALPTPRLRTPHRRLHRQRWCPTTELQNYSVYTILGTHELT